MRCCGRLSRPDPARFTKQRVVTAFPNARVQVRTHRTRAKQPARFGLDRRCRLEGCLSDWQTRGPGKAAGLRLAGGFGNKGYTQPNPPISASRTAGWGKNIPATPRHEPAPSLEMRPKTHWRRQDFAGKNTSSLARPHTAAVDGIVWRFGGVGGVGGVGAESASLLV
jgi:hypothetical protein